jgi:hypothetical protein
MQMRMISTGSEPEVLISDLPSDLRVTGWDRNEVQAKTSGDRLTLTEGPAAVTVSCDDDLILSLPRAARLTILSVGGDVTVRGLSGQVKIQDIGGELSTRQTGGLIIENVGGDLSLRSVGGDLKVASSSGDVSVRGLDGRADFASCGGSLYLRDLRDGLLGDVGGDAVLYVVPNPGQEYHLSAGGDILLRLPADADATLTMNAGGDLRVDLPNVPVVEEIQSPYVVTLGSGAAKMDLSAGSDLQVTYRAGEWESFAEFGDLIDEAFTIDIPEIPPIPPIPPIPGVPSDLHDMVQARVREQMSRSQDRIEHKVEAAARRAEIKAEAAMRRAEAKMRSAEARARAVDRRMRGAGVTIDSSGRGPKVEMNVGRWHWDMTPRGPAPKADPVTDEERLSILKMLQEKKITLEEAEKLLSALE